MNCLLPNKKLIGEAIKSDWAFVRAKTGLSPQQIWQYKNQKRHTHTINIEIELIRAIKQRKSTYKNHQKRIQDSLKNFEPKNIITELNKKFKIND